MTDRHILIATLNSTVTGSQSLGEFSTGQFSRLGGLFSLSVGSATFRYRMGVQSGNYAVSSTFVVNSGGSVFDVLSYGRTTDFAFTAANSTQFSALVWGEVQR